jgi:hypothetical protein
MQVHGVAIAHADLGAPFLSYVLVCSASFVHSISDSLPLAMS